MTKPLKILFKYPSRGRRKLFLEGMDSIMNNLFDKENFHILVSADEDDPDMDFTGTDISYPNTTICYGISKSKIHAVNRDIEKAQPDWDILIVMSDDMRFTFYGFDQIIRTEMADNLDRLLHIPDNDAKSILAVMYISGKPFYERFGYIYNPVYESLFADNEIMDIARRLGKYKYANIPGLIFHANPAYGHLPKDEMFLRQQEIGYTKDQQTYNERRLKRFDL